MPIYTCQYCQHVFSLKTDLERHLKKKNACIPIAQLQQQQQINREQEQDKNGNVQEISNIFKTCLDILRNDEGHLVGDEALPELSRMIIYKQMEKLIDNGTIDLTQMKNHAAVVAKWGTKYDENISFSKFSRLLAYINENHDNILNLKKIMNEFLWKTIGSNHPKLKCVFPEEGKFAIKTPQTFKELMISLSKVDFNKYNFDILGEAYERLFVDAIFGAGGNKKSELGQYFTPRQVIQFMINEVELKIKENGEIESFADFSCGTGGILITAINNYRKFIQQGVITEEELKEQFKKKLFGIEIKDKLFNLCAANILLHTGEVLENIILGDSIRKYWNIKVDKIVMNPPFSVKIDYDSLFIQRNDNNNLHLNINEIMPIRVGGKNSESLFLQVMIHCLNIGGKCATVMLDGQKMDNSNAGNREVREYLMKSCNLESVIYCQGGTFTSTASKTCILIFTKKKERVDVVTITGTGIKRSYEFTKTHATKTVKFYDYRPEIEGCKFLLDEVPISKIAAKNYSLRLQDYDEEEEQEEIEDVKWMKLEKICDIKIGGTPSRSNTSFWENGIYPWVSIRDMNTKVITETKEKITQKGVKNSSVKLIPKDTILFSFKLSIGKISISGCDLFTNEAIAALIINSEFILRDYLYFYLLIQNEFKGQKGCIGNGSLNKESLGNIQIPIPSIAIQQNFIDYCENMNTNNQQIKQTIELLKKNNDNLLNMCSMRFTIGKQYNMKKLVTVLDDINTSKVIPTGERKDGIYDYYSCSRTKMTSDEHHYEGNYLIQGSRGSTITESLFISNGKFAVGTSVFISKTKNDGVMLKYVYYFLKNNEKLYKISGASIPMISKTTFYDIQIPIRSLYDQKNIVDFCELQQERISQNDKLIEELQKTIDQSSENAKQFLELLIQNSVVPEIKEETIEVSQESFDQNDEQIPSLFSQILEESTKTKKSNKKESTKNGNESTIILPKKKEVVKKIRQ